jgi:hypothetical protein
MSLAPDEQRALAEIVSELRRSDPALAAMFTILIKAAGRKPTARELLPRREPTPTDRGQTRRTVLARTITLFAVCVALAIACIVLAATATSRAGPPQNGCMLGAGAAINVYSPERLFPCPCRVTCSRSLARRSRRKLPTRRTGAGPPVWGAARGWAGAHGTRAVRTTCAAAAGASAFVADK